MKLWESTHVFDHPWETVTHAAWRKYPNPINPAVKGIDILDRSVSSDGVLRSRRLLKTEWDIPNWVTNLIGLTNPSYSHEESEVDANQKHMTLKTINLTCTNFITIDERLKYEPHPTESTKTLLTQTTEVTMHGVPLADYLENMVIKTFSANAGKGRQALDWVANNIVREYDELTAKFNSELAELNKKAKSEMDAINRELAATQRQRRASLRNFLRNLTHHSSQLNERRDSLVLHDIDFLQ